MVYGWFRVRWGGRILTIRGIGPAGYKSSFAAGRQTPRSNRAAEFVARTWRCSSVRVPAQLPSNSITKQSQFLITPFVPGTYRNLGGLIAMTSFGLLAVLNVGFKNVGAACRARARGAARALY